MTALEATWPWRTGRSVGRTIYACPSGAITGEEGDVLIGMMDSPEIAEAVVTAHNNLYVVEVMTRPGEGQCTSVNIVHSVVASWLGGTEIDDNA